MHNFLSRTLSNNSNNGSLARTLSITPESVSNSYRSFSCAFIRHFSIIFHSFAAWFSFFFSFQSAPGVLTSVAPFESSPSCISACVSTLPTSRSSEQFIFRQQIFSANGKVFILRWIAQFCIYPNFQYCCSFSIFLCVSQIQIFLRKHNCSLKRPAKVVSINIHSQLLAGMKISKRID